MRTERVENALHLGIPQGGYADVGMTQTTSSGVQAEAQTSSSGVQVNVRPIITSSGTQSSTTRMEESETQTRYIRKKKKVVKRLKIDLVK